MKPKPGINSLHNLHGQLSGIHDSIAFLKSNKFEHDLRFSGIILFYITRVQMPHILCAQ